MELYHEMKVRPPPKYDSPLYSLKRPLFLRPLQTLVYAHLPGENGLSDYNIQFIFHLF